MTDGISAAALDNLIGLKTPEERIKWLPASDKKPSLAYIDARLVMEILDSALIGPGNWQCAYAFGPSEKIACGIAIKVDGEWLWKWDGAGETDIEGEKGSFSDAFKRAAVRWGIGRDLYSMKPRGTVDPRDAQSQHYSAPVTTSSPGPVSEGATGSGDGQTPVCPFHGAAGVTRSRYPDRVTGIVGWYCRERAGNGSPENAKGYCGWRSAA